MRLLILTILGFVFISVIGTLSHFLYDLLGHKKWAAIFFSVNESVWEHIKIALTPFFMWTIIEIPFLYSDSNFIFAKFLSLVTLIVSIPLIFYLVKFIFNKTYLIVDILIFYLSIFLSQMVFYLFMKISFVGSFLNYISFIGIIIIFGSYLLLTIFPLKKEIFKDPLTNKYGIKAHSDKK